MRHKMRFVWIFILTLMTSGVTLTEGTLEPWGFSQLLSLLGHGDHGTESDPIQHTSLSRHKRASPRTPTEYVMDVEISFPDPSMAAQIKQYLTNSLTYPLPLGSGDTNITSIKVTTACNQTGSEVQCTCESGYTWSTDVCTTYTPCPGINNCSCIKGTTFPTQYCQAQTVEINLSLKLLTNFTSDLQNPSSTNYKDLKSKLEVQFNLTYQTLPGFKSATVTSFRPGSVIADYVLVSEPTTTDALTTANKDLISNLNTNLNLSSSVSTVVLGWSSISVNPNSIFLNDTVTLTCTVNVTTFSDVSWYFNGTQKIVNSSSWSFTTTSIASGIQSTLTINRSSIDHSGSYRCNVDLISSTYTTETTIQVNTMELTALNSTVTCDNTKVPIIQCCTKQGTVTFNLTCQKTSGNIIGISESSSLCQSYNIMAPSQSCSSTSGFSCTCSTLKGALLRQDIAVTYQMPYQVNVTGSSDRISEWTDLTLKCNCGSKNVQSMNWYFTANDNVPNPINSNAYTFIPGTCSSTLTIPSANTSISWNGTFICEVDGNYSANKSILVFRRAKSSDITRSPISEGFQCGSKIKFSCRVDHMDAYTSSKTTLNIKISGGSLVIRNMPFSGNDFQLEYTTDANCADLEAFCTITNLLGDTVNSGVMNLKRVENPQCTGVIPNTNVSIGVGQAGATSIVSCQQIISNLEGNRIYICNGNTMQWEISSDKCVSKALNTLNNQVMDLATSPNPEQKVPSAVSQLKDAVIKDQDFTSAPSNIQVVVKIMQTIGSVVKEVQPTVMKDFLNAVSTVVDNSATNTWNKVENKTSESSNLLQSVERFAEKLVFDNNGVTINNKNVHLIGNLTGNSPSNFNADFNFTQLNDLTGNVFIDKTALESLPNDTRVVSVAYATLKDIISVPENSTTNQTVNGLVMTTVLTNNPSNFTIGMDFKKSNTSLDNATCVWWNFKTQDWDPDGCRIIAQKNNETVSCVCNHLTSFSILMSTSVLPPDVEKALTYITYVGVGISMLSLVVCIIIESMIWKSVTKNKTSYLRHVCIVNIAVTLLMADIWFIIGATMNTTDKVQACIAATFFAHLFYLCVFFWMLTMGLILFYRLMCVFHDLSKTTMMGISFFLGYGCPVIISVITVAVTKSQNNYLIENKCWLNIEQSKAFLAFIIPAFAILLVNFITLVVVIVKVLRPSVGDKPKKEEKSSLNHIAKCILILTPLLGLTWGFGIGTMVSKTVAIHGIFAALNSLQGLFILLFGCLMDKKVRDALLSRFSLSRWSSQQTKSSNLSSSEPVFTKGGINVFGKKGVYNISSAQMNSSSELASNSYSLLT
ncbi:adhesion G protein-coupled receptor F5-like [Pyxicephalus adspersus]|uniref:adhesion G protein-coupled receptor F5-like n=1 Tax=Pyxicephalus adspersus TaxID=30357 RepID=UPI003B5B297E